MPAPLIDSTPLNTNATYLRWGDFRSLFVANSSPIFYAYDTIKYTVYSQIGPILFACELVSSTQSGNIQWPTSYPQAQNDIDVAEFTGQWQARANLAGASVSDNAKIIERLNELVRLNLKANKKLKKLKRCMARL